MFYHRDQRLRPLPLHEQSGNIISVSWISPVEEGVCQDRQIAIGLGMLRERLEILLRQVGVGMPGIGPAG
jgi:hypothetical protein